MSRQRRLIVCPDDDRVPATCVPMASLNHRVRFVPAVLKPRASYRLGGTSEKQAVSILHSQKEVERALAHIEPGRFLAEGFFSGVGVGLSVLAQDGQIARTYQHRRLQAASPTGPSTRRISEPVDPQLQREVASMVQAASTDGRSENGSRSSPIPWRRFIDADLSGISAMRGNTGERG